MQRLISSLCICIVCSIVPSYAAPNFSETSLPTIQKISIEKTSEQGWPVAITEVTLKWRSNRPTEFYIIMASNNSTNNGFGKPDPLMPNCDSISLGTRSIRQVDILSESQSGVEFTTNYRFKNPIIDRQTTQYRGEMCRTNHKIQYLSIVDEAERRKVLTVPANIAFDNPGIPMIQTSQYKVLQQAEFWKSIQSASLCPLAFPNANYTPWNSYFANCDSFDISSIVLSIAQSDFTEAKAKAEAEVKAKAEAAKKKTTITCIKGKITKKVIAVNPKCPTGYTRR